MADERAKQLNQPSNGRRGKRDTAPEKSGLGQMDDRQGDQAVRSPAAIVAAPDFEIEIQIL
jgi:hypothetical protein